MRICGGNVEEMSTLMGTRMCTKGFMACSHPEGMAEGVVCDADIYVEDPAEYLRQCVESSSITEAVREIYQNVKGGYACAVEKNGALYLFRDPVGLKPLYYKDMTFASEKKAFTTEPVPLLPGELVKLLDTVLFREKINEVFTTDPEEVLNNLEKSAHQQIEEATILFSGGIDSSILAALSDAALVTCGLESSQDLLFSRRAASLLGKDLTEVVVSPEEIEEAYPRVLSMIDEKTQMNLEIGLLLYFVCQEIDSRILISGQGADELFGGYLKYEKAFRQGNVKALMRHDFDTLYLGLERDSCIVERAGKIMRYPYLDSDVVKGALGIPSELLFEPRKKFLQQIARCLSVPEEIVVRPKKALQYGSGIHKVVRKFSF